jgi:hypothetical protein
MLESANGMLVPAYVRSLEQRLGTVSKPEDLALLVRTATDCLTAVGDGNAIFNSLPRAIHLTEVVLAVLQGRQLMLKRRLFGAEAIDCLLAIWAHSAVFSSLLTGDERLAPGIAADGWWPWSRDRSRRLCEHLAARGEMRSVARLSRLAAACHFLGDQDAAGPAEDRDLARLLHAAWLFSFACDPGGKRRFKPLWGVLQHWAGASAAEPIGLPVPIPQWVEFPQWWKAWVDTWVDSSVPKEFASIRDFLRQSSAGNDYLDMVFGARLQDAESIDDDDR